MRHMERHYRSLLSMILDPDLYVLQLGEDDFGLYATRAVNNFNSPLMVRGTKAEIEEFMEKNRLPRPHGG